MVTKPNPGGPPPEIRSWLDRCLVPQLAREYIAKLEKQGKVEATKTPEVSR